MAENYWQVECHDRDGRLKWRDTFANLVVNAGLDDVLDKYFRGSSYTAAHYVIMMDGTPTVASGDTMASHAGWVEVTAYDESTRPAFTPGSVSSQAVSNTASKAAITISSNGTTIGGCGLVTNSTKGGTSGILYGGGAFTSGDKTLDDGDVLSVTVTATQAAA